MDISRLLCRMCRENRNKTRDEEQKKIQKQIIKRKHAKSNTKKHYLCIVYKPKRKRRKKKILIVGETHTQNKTRLNKREMLARWISVAWGLKLLH